MGCSCPLQHKRTVHVYVVSGETEQTVGHQNNNRRSFFYQTKAFITARFHYHGAKSLYDIQFI